MGVIFIFSASKFLFVKGGLPYENVTKLWTLSKSLVLATTPGIGPPPFGLTLIELLPIGLPPFGLGLKGGCFIIKFCRIQISR